MEYVVLVDEQDQQMGIMEKMEAHRTGSLHRAFSIFIFNHNNELLLQQRAIGKYHSAGLWTNTCCSHPRPTEETQEAAARRLKEEMGLSCELHNVFSFLYMAQFDNGLTEHEFDHVFVGRTSEEPVPSPEEVNAYRYVNRDDLEREMNQYPERFTVWFRICFEKYQDVLFAPEN